MDSKTNYKNMLLVLLLVVAGLAGAMMPQQAAAKSKIQFDPNTLYVPAEGGVYEVTIRCKESFWISDITTPSWIQLFTSHGLPKGSDKWFTLPFFFRPNTEGSRKGVITFKTSEGEVKFQMIQLGGAKPGSDKAIFTLSPEELDMREYADEVRVTLSCNLAYRFVDKIDKPNWLEVEEEEIWSYDLKKSIPIISKTNAGGKREGVITFKTSEGDVKLKVTQEGGADPKSIITLAPKQLKVDAEGGEHKVTLSSEQGFDVSNLVIMPSWIRQGQSSSGPGVYEYTFKFQPNTGPERTADVVFTIGQGEIKLKVTQAGGAKPEPKPEPKPEAELTLDPKELKVEAEGGEHKVTLSSTLTIEKMDFEKPDWIRYSYSPESHTSKAVYLTFEPNTGPERTADVVFKTSAGDVTLKVTQAAVKPEFTLDPKELKVEAKGGEHQVTLSSEQDFELNKVTLPSWMNQNPSLWHKGPGLFICTFTFDPNTGPERTADVVIKTDKGEVTLKVTQAAGSTKPEKAVFTLEPKELKVEADGGKKEVKLSCNQAFELNKVTVPSWMERVPSSATSDEKSRVCAFNIKPNTGAERKGEIIFHTDKGNITLKVTQAGKKEKPEPTLTLSPDMLTFPTGGGKQTVNVKSDYGWDTKASAASASWMKLTTDVKTGKIVVEVTPNTSTKKRGATIQVVSSRRRIGHRTPITRHILVTQEAAKAVEPPVAATGISLNPAAMTMGSGGGTVGFNVYAGKGWTISGSPDWMHPDATRGSGTRLVIVRFDRNESGAERTGKLTVKSDDGKAERTFTLTQRAGQRKPTPSPGSTPSEEYDYDLALNPEEITVGPSDGAGSSISVATSRLWAGSTTEDWIRLESAVGRGNGTFTFRLAANPSKEMRHGTITVRTQQGMDELKVAIHQQGNDGSVVPPAEVKVSNVTLDPATLTVNGDLSTALISAIVSPDNARNKGLLWMSTNASVATVQVFTPKQSAALPQLRFAPDADDYALVTIVGKGKAVITAAASDGSGIVARCEVNVLSTVANTVPYAPQAKVYTVGPTLYLSLPTAETVQVYTLAGTLYRTWQAPAGDTSVTLPAGTYIIKVGQLTEKVVVR